MLLNGRAPERGEIMYMPNLAKTLREVAAHGKKVLLGLLCWRPIRKGPAAFICAESPTLQETMARCCGPYYAITLQCLSSGCCVARMSDGLAPTLRQGFYEWRIAQSIVDVVQSLGGVMCLEDLKSHTSSVVEPIS